MSISMQPLEPPPSLNLCCVFLLYLEVELSQYPRQLLTHGLVRSICTATSTQGQDTLSHPKMLRPWPLVQVG